MDKQVIITIGREYGSGGHVIAQDIAKRFNVPYYNRNLIEEVAKQNNFDTDNIKDYDESPRKYLFSRTVQGYSNSPEEILAGLQFDFIKEKAASGDCVASFFIVADNEAKLQRTMETKQLSQRDAEATIKRHDRNRKTYYKDHTDMEWGNSKNYDMTINSTVLGFKKTADIIEDFVKTKFDL